MAEYYRIQPKLTSITEDEFNSQEAGIPKVAVLSPKEASGNMFLQKYHLQNLHLFGQAHFCKAETHMGFLCGTFALPSPKVHEKNGRFSYLLAGGKLIFLEEGSHVSKILRRLSESFDGSHAGLGLFLAAFMETLIEHDLERLIKIENELAHLEDDVLSGKLDQFNQKLSACRRQILVYSHYYLQLADIGSILQQNGSDFFTDSELTALRLFSERIGRLHEEALMLREYSTQVREVYQSQIDIRQNNIMKILTVVTTVFMPLTLIAGWYGMNFTAMPELNWKYGYAAVIILSAATVSLCIYLCKKKHFL